VSDEINDQTPPPQAPSEKGVSPIAIEDELKRSYLDYAMSVIVSRALPDARDGLKPVHRRILWSMHENGFTHDKPYRKSARIVGDVMGKYHPHGDTAIYDALVRMAQDFSMSLPLIDGQGNFGSMDGDPPAAMRYTESRMAKPAGELLADIDRNTVDFQPNYDGSEHEPVVLPARFPNLLVNGGAGIAVGMATNIPPHNLGEVIDATVALIDNPAATDLDLITLIPGPDFPTGALIIGQSAARQALLNGRGSVIMRAKTHIEEVRKDREAIVVTEIPYQVNKASMIEKIAELVREKKIEGIAELRDESDRKGVRVVVELKRDANTDVILNQLYRFTPLQTSFGVNMLALDGGRPRMMGLRAILESFIAFREEVVTRRTKYELAKARDRGHLVVGLALAVANIDEVIRIIRESRDGAEARERLMARDWPAADTAPLIALIADPRSQIREDGTIRMTEEQARAILDLRLQRLTGLAREELAKEAQEIAETIQRLLTILGSIELIRGIIREELVEVKAAYAKPRRTEIVEADLEIDDESLIAREDMVVTVTHGGYVKRTALATYRTQRRGGKGRSGMATKEEDFITRLFVANTHQPVLFFTSGGMVYKEKIWRLPEGAPQSKGKALVNMLPLEKGETITSIMALPEDEALWDTLDVMFATKSGGVRRNKLSDFVQVNRNGKIAMKPDEGDSIVDVQMCTENDDILLTTGRGMCIRFPVPEVRVFQGRTSTGVRGISLADGDELIGMSVLRHVDAEPAEARGYLRHAAAMRRAVGDEVSDVAPEAVEQDETETGEAALTPERIAELGAREQFVLTISDRGVGKRSSAYEYRVTGRGGKGIVAHRLTDSNAKLAGAFPVDDEDELLLVSDAGQLIRCPVSEIRIAARATQGVNLMRIDDGERVVAVERLIDLSGGERE
jgi:DNA gyrase subunit A